MARPFARTFDLISEAYGWTDDQILDLTIARMRQIREVIIIRQNAEWRRDVNLQEAKIQQIAGAVHAAAGNKKGANAAREIRFIEPPARRQVFASMEKATQTFPVDPAFGLITDDEIQAEIERLRAEGVI